MATAGQILCAGAPMSMLHARQRRTFLRHSDYVRSVTRRWRFRDVDRPLARAARISVAALLNPSRSRSSISCVNRAPRRPRPSAASFEIADVLRRQSRLAIRTIAPSRLVFVLAVPLRSRFVARIGVERGRRRATAAVPLPCRRQRRPYLRTIGDVLVSPETQAGWTDIHADLRPMPAGNGAYSIVRRRAAGGSS